MEAEHEEWWYSSILESLDMPIKLPAVFFLAVRDSEGCFYCFWKQLQGNCFSEDYFFGAWGSSCCQIPGVK